MISFFTLRIIAFITISCFCTIHYNILLSFIFSFTARLHSNSLSLQFSHFHIFVSLKKITIIIFYFDFTKLYQLSFKLHYTQSHFKHLYSTLHTAYLYMQWIPPPCALFNTFNCIGTYFAEQHTTLLLFFTEATQTSTQ